MDLADTLSLTASFNENLIHKSLRRTERGLRARLNSILHDARLTLHVYQSLLADASKPAPIFANARAGCWYTPPHLTLSAATRISTRSCAFKSADGHYGQWASSLRRPNVHVFQAAVQDGVVVIVDVTRAGKKYPDSFSKTVPIWCAVLNVVAGLVECECGDKASAEDICERCVKIHLHSDVPSSECAQIRARLPHWVRDWSRSKSELGSFIPSITAARKKRMKPLRALWLRTGRPIWERGLVLSDLDFTPVVCISGSAVVERGLRSFVEPRGNDVVCGVRFPPVVTGFPYVQGAGDDEEAWCLGLTPRLFWRHFRDVAALVDGGCGEAAEVIEGRVRAWVEGVVEGERGRVLELAAGEIGVRVWRAGIRVVCGGGMASRSGVEARMREFGAVIVLGGSDPLQGVEECGGEMGRNLHWVSLTDRKGKTDYKYGFGRALGSCLSRLRDCCVDQGREALICCGSRNGDWGAGLAIAWLAWHCSVGEDGEGGSVYKVERERRGSVQGVAKENIHATMLHFLSAYPQFEISRATLKQLNRFFSSPAPSSRVSEVDR